MAQAVRLAKLFDPTPPDWALGHAAVHDRSPSRPSLHSRLHSTGPGQQVQHRVGESASLIQRQAQTGPMDARSLRARSRTGACGSVTLLTCSVSVDAPGSFVVGLDVMVSREPGYHLAAGSLQSSSASLRPLSAAWRGTPGDQIVKCSPERSRGTSSRRSHASSRRPRLGLPHDLKDQTRRALTRQPPPQPRLPEDWSTPFSPVDSCTFGVP